MTAKHDDVAFKVWSCEVIIGMCAVALHDSEPEEVMREWFNSFGDSDDYYLRWAMGMWDTIRNMDSQKLETARRNANAMSLRLLPTPNPEIPF